LLSNAEVVWADSEPASIAEIVSAASSTNRECRMSGDLAGSAPSIRVSHFIQLARS
jgi:hypothetical protein